MARTVPAMLTEVPGNFITAALWNAQVRDLGNFTTGVPFFSGYQNAAQSVPNNTWTAVTLDSETFDTEGGHSTVTNTSRYVCQVAGVYQVFACSTFFANATAVRGSKIVKNGTPVLGGQTIMGAAPSSGNVVVCTIPVQLAVNDYIEVFAFQNSGGALNSLVNAEVCPTLTAVWTRT